MIRNFANGRKRHLAGLIVVWLSSIFIMNMVLPTIAKHIIDAASHQPSPKIFFWHLESSRLFQSLTPQEAAVVALTIAAGFLVVLNGFITYASQVYERWTQNVFYKSISIDLLGKVISANPSFLQISSPAYLRSLINQEAGNCSSMMLGLFSNTVVSSITLLVAIAFIARESISILIFFVLLMPFYYLSIRGIPEKIKVKSKEGIELAVLTQNSLDKILNSWRTAILYNLQEKALRNYDGCLQKSLGLSQKLAGLQANFSARTSTFASLCQFILLAIIAWQAISGKMTIGSAIALSGVFSSFLNSFRSLCQISNSYKSFQVSLERIRHLYASCSQSDHRLVTDSDSSEIVRFKDVTFKLDESVLFESLNYKILHGEKVQISGPNGCGKSTLIDLIVGFKIAEGEIFSPPLRNISFCFPNQAFLPFSLREHTSDFVKTPAEYLLFERLVDQFDLGMILDHEPNLLSSGQKQKVSILLALLKRSDLYIFDEALANIDKEGRLRIGEIIADQTKGKTVISITHESNLDENQGRIIKLKKMNRIA